MTGPPIRDRARLESTVSAPASSLTWLRPDHDRLRDLPAAGGMHSSTYFRLLLDKALPDSVTRRHARTIALWDQEALNAVLAGRWSALDGRWNSIASVAGRRFHESGKTPAAIRRSEPAWIYHFAGDWKPWTLLYGRHPHGLFYQFLDETPWAGWRPRASISRRLRAFYHENLRDVLYPLESRYTRFPYGRLTRAGR